MNIINQLINKPIYGKIFYYFAEISKIPRQSGNEKAISDYLVSFAKEKGLFVRQDDYLNVVIKKPATAGYENYPGVIIQGHMDMVCEKNIGVEHDFDKDPIELVVDNDILSANGTTLGADNGIAIAYALALLDSDNINHPFIEVIITTDEEVGLTGAIKMDVSDIKGKYYINLDSEEEGELTISCAGGLRVYLRQPVNFQYLDKKNYIVKDVILKGLKGGHSGMEIDKNRANSNKLTGRILCSLNEKVDIHLMDIHGGKKDNVIPRETFFTLAINKRDEDKFNQVIDAVLNDIKNEYSTSDPDITIEIVNKETNSKIQVFDNKTLNDLIFVLMNIPNGIQTMSNIVPNLVESSLNLGTVYYQDGKINFESALRSSVRSKKYHMSKQLELFAKQLNFEYTQTADYPEWPLKKDSKFLSHCVNTYEKLYGKKPIVKGIHAGLESGVFLDKLPHLEAVSIGPNIYDVHSPDEHISISSVERTWDYLIEIITSIKNI